MVRQVKAWGTLWRRPTLPTFEAWHKHHSTAIFPSRSKNAEAESFHKYCPKPAPDGHEPIPHSDAICYRAWLRKTIPETRLCMHLWFCFSYLISYLIWLVVYAYRERGRSFVDLFSNQKITVFNTYVSWVSCKAYLTYTGHPWLILASLGWAPSARATCQVWGTESPLKCIPRYQDHLVLQDPGSPRATTPGAIMAMTWMWWKSEMMTSTQRQNLQVQGGIPGKGLPQIASNLPSSSVTTHCEGWFEASMQLDKAFGLL